MGRQQDKHTNTPQRGPDIFKSQDQMCKQEKFFLKEGIL